MNLNAKQRETKARIEVVAGIIGVDPRWAVAVAFVESSLGLKQKSPTGCRGVFQMSSVAMKDLWLEMEKADDDMVDICCGLLFLRLLYKRHKSMIAATERFCDPDDKDFYVKRVFDTMEEIESEKL